MLLQISTLSMDIDFKLNHIRAVLTNIGQNIKGSMDQFIFKLLTIISITFSVAFCDENIWDYIYPEMNKISKEFNLKYNIKLVGSGGGSEYDINTINMHFLTNCEFTVNHAREVCTYGISQLQKQINGLKK